MASRVQAWPDKVRCICTSLNTSSAPVQVSGSNSGNNNGNGNIGSGNGNGNGEVNPRPQMRLLHASVGHQRHMSRHWQEPLPLCVSPGAVLLERSSIP